MEWDRLSACKGEQALQLQDCTAHDTLWLQASEFLLSDMENLLWICTCIYICASSLEQYSLEYLTNDAPQYHPGEAVQMAR